MFQFSEPGFKALRTNRDGAINLRQRRAWSADETLEETPAKETPPPKSGESAGATFTQADLDRIVGKTRKEARETGIAEFLKDLGFEKPDDLKSMVTAFKSADEAEKSELEKAQKRIADLEKAKVEAETAATKAQQERMEERRNAAILTALTGAEKPQSVLNLLLVEHAADVTALMAEDGTIDAKKVGALADKAKKEYAGMFKSGNPGSQSHSGGKTPMPDKENLLKQIRAKI